MADIKSIIDRVRKLLSLANSSNANEAAVATAKANKLIDEYRISRDQLNTDSDPLEHAETEPLYEADRAATWRMNLAVLLSRHYGCFIFNNTTKRAAYYQVAGRKSDVAILRYMFAYVDSECMRLSVQISKGKGRTYAESYRRGLERNHKLKTAPTRTVRQDPSAYTSGKQAGRSLHTGNALGSAAGTRLLG